MKRFINSPHSVVNSFPEFGLLIDEYDFPLTRYVVMDGKPYIWWWCDEVRIHGTTHTIGILFPCDYETPPYELACDPKDVPDGWQRSTTPLCEDPEDEEDMILATLWKRGLQQDRLIITIQSYPSNSLESDYDITLKSVSVSDIPDGAIPHQFIAENATGDK